MKKRTCLNKSKIEFRSKASEITRKTSEQPQVCECKSSGCWRHTNLITLNRKLQSIFQHHESKLQDSKSLKKPFCNHLLSCEKPIAFLRHILLPLLKWLLQNTICC